MVLSSAAASEKMNQISLKWLNELKKDNWTSTVVFTEMKTPEVAGIWDGFAKVTYDMFELPNFLRLIDAPRFLGSLVVTRDPSVVMIGNSNIGLMSLPIIRKHLTRGIVVGYGHRAEDIAEKTKCFDLRIGDVERFKAAAIAKLSSHGLPHRRTIMHLQPPREPVTSWISVSACKYDYYS